MIVGTLATSSPHLIRSAGRAAARISLLTELRRDPPAPASESSLAWLGPGWQPRALFFIQILTATTTPSTPAPPSE